MAKAIATAVADGVLLKRDADGIAAFYAARGNQPVWIADDAFTPEALALIARIERADEDGLNPGRLRAAVDGGRALSRFAQ